MSATPRHALVTGATGFVGRVLCERLRATGVRVSAIARRSVEGPWDRLIEWDLATARTPALPDDVDTVFHLAGHAHASDGEGSARLHRAVSEEGTRRLLGVLPPEVARIVYLSSVKAMGETTPPEGADESTPARPTTDYGRARRTAEQVLEGAAGEELAVSVLRSPLVYGVGVRGNLERMMGAVLARRMPLLPEFGNRRSMVHVDDLADALIAASRRGGAGARLFLVSDGADLSPRQVVELMYTAAGRRPLLPPLPAWALRAGARTGDWLTALGIPGIPLRQEVLEKLAANAVYRSGRAREELGWAPRAQLRAALPAMLRYLAGYR